MGGKGGSSDSGGSTDNPYAAFQSGLASAQYTLTKPMRENMLRDWERMFGYTHTDPYAMDPSNVSPGDNRLRTATTMNPADLPTYAPLFGLQKQSLEQQYQMARKNLMGSVAPGGNLAGGLADIESSRAANVGALPAQLAGNITQDLYNKAYGYVTGVPQQSIAGIGNAAQTYASTQNAALQAAGQQYGSDQALAGATYGGIGQGIGKGLARVGGKAAMA